MLSKNRNAWVDYAKAIGIVLVVYGHVARGLDASGIVSSNFGLALADSIIYSFHMPLFFFLSGLFFHNSFIQRGFNGFIYTKIDSVLFPYLVWSFIQGGLEVSLSKYTNGDIEFLSLFTLLWNPRAQFWFIYALFLIFFVFSLLHKVVPNIKPVNSFILFGCLYIFKDDLSSNRLIGYVLTNGVFFSFGILYNHLSTYLNAAKGKDVLIYFFLFTLLQIVFHIEMGFRYDHGGFPSLILALVSILFVTKLSMFVSQFEISIFQTIGSTSMIIYLMHILAGSGARIFLQNILHIQSVWAHLVIGSAVGIFLPILALYVIRRLHLGVLLNPPNWLSAVQISKRHKTNS